MQAQSAFSSNCDPPQYKGNQASADDGDRSDGLAAFRISRKLRAGCATRVTQC